MNIFATANRCRKTRAKASALVASGLLIATCLGVSAFSVQVTQPHKSDADFSHSLELGKRNSKGRSSRPSRLAVKEDKVTGTISHANVGCGPEKRRAYRP